MKHRGALKRHGIFGRVMLPLVWIFQFLLQWMAPLVDLQLLVAAFSTVFSWDVNGASHGQWVSDEMTLDFLRKTAFFYAAFFAVEMGGAWYAVKLDREDKTLLWWLFWQRFVYRQMLYFVIGKATWMALAGLRQGWNKLARKGTVFMLANIALE